MGDLMDTTVEYYNANAEEYIKTTQMLDMSLFYRAFEEYLF